MKTFWKWVIGIVIGLVILAVIVGGTFALGYFGPRMALTLQARGYNGGYGPGGMMRPRGNDQYGNRGYGPGFYPHGMMGRGFGFMRPMMFGFGFFPFGLFMWIIPLAVLGLAIYGVVALVRRPPASAAPAAAAPAEVASAAPARTCGNCGKPAQEDWKTCPYCGTAL